MNPHVSSGPSRYLQILTAAHKTMRTEGGAVERYMGRWCEDELLTVGLVLLRRKETRSRATAKRESRSRSAV